MTKVSAKDIRQAARKLGVFTWDDLSNEMEIPTYKERLRMKDIARDFLKRGEFIRIEDGRFEYKALPKRRTKLDVIWHLVRSHKTFTTAEMERLSGSTLGTVYEYLLCLKSLGYIRGGNQQGWLLVKDPGPETPVNTTKCRRLKSIRAKNKKEAQGKS